ncbi:MobE homing endonuclease [Aeromonas phage Aeh1]|uniref:MobE homing endonuclease n=1 Tax=Aeromonas phage Aeh1 TaxID=2880362 RepID=Q76Z43_9CAUD|nr:homing endonuclease [Aeromonas phage Aeh1]AAQ17703.1 MobE homing endonuclease [Aeromonas phage Aeh1]
MNYKRIHDLIINKFKNSEISGYKEKHHIIPRCMGGDDSDDNLVYLTAKAHYVVHHLLTKIYKSNKLIFAYNMMRVGNKEHSRVYAYMHESNRVKLAKALSEVKTGSIAPNKGKPMSDVQREKLSYLWRFVSPTGEEHIVSGLKDFCLKHGLNPSTMSAVCRGKRSNHHGWKLYKLGDDEHNKEYVPKSRATNLGKPAPNGIKIVIGGIEYPSIGIAMKETGISRFILNRRFRENDRT